MKAGKKNNMYLNSLKKEGMRNTETALLQVMHENTVFPKIIARSIPIGDLFLLRCNSN